jgi:hypothetical protein
MMRSAQSESDATGKAGVQRYLPIKQIIWTSEINRSTIETMSVNTATMSLNGTNRGRSILPVNGPSAYTASFLHPKGIDSTSRDLNPVDQRLAHGLIAMFRRDDTSPVASLCGDLSTGSYDMSNSRAPTRLSK